MAQAHKSAGLALRRPGKPRRGRHSWRRASSGSASRARRDGTPKSGRARVPGRVDPLDPEPVSDDSRNPTLGATRQLYRQILSGTNEEESSELLPHLFPLHSAAFADWLGDRRVGQADAVVIAAKAR